MTNFKASLIPNTYNQNFLAAPLSEPLRAATHLNVGRSERITSGLLAVGLATLAVRQLSRSRIFSGLGWLGGATALAWRAASGHCPLYQSIGMNTASDGSDLVDDKHTLKTNQGIKVDKTIVIQRRPEEIFKFWRKLENLPEIMHHLESVQTSEGGKKSHWVVKAPAGLRVEWDAEIINEHTNELLAWRSLKGAEVDNAGSVRFTDLGSEGTELKVSLKYDPPGGMLGAAVAKLFDRDAENEIEKDLQTFKERMERGDFQSA